MEEEQQGKDRAEYGKKVLTDLSTRLTVRFGKGFSVDNLQNMRRFYLAYSIYETPSRKLEKNTKKHSPQITDTKIPNTESSTPHFRISWSHYLILLRIDNLNERSFYEIESASNNWSLAELKRQYHSSLYERLALSRNKEDVLKVANEGHTFEKPEDILKNPLSLEFLGIEEKDSYTESDLEQAIISKLQNSYWSLERVFCSKQDKNALLSKMNITS